MTTVAEQIRLSVVIFRLESLQREYDEALERLMIQQTLVTGLNWEMSELWIEKASLERRNGYTHARVFT